MMASTMTDLYSPFPRRRRLPPASPRLSRHSALGFTILEALIGAAILTVSISGAAIIASQEWASSADLDVMSRIDNAVASDSAWLKTYAKYWRMVSGPYSITCTQAGFPSACRAFVYSATSSEYEPDPDQNLCPNATSTGAPTALANAFVTAAASVTINPARPYTVAIGETILINSATDTGQPRLPSGTHLARDIRLSGNLIYISYSFIGANAATYKFRREVAIRPEAASWCP